jgi:uncharacterized membrane protein
MEVLVVLSRWLHVMSAIVAIGGAFFMRFVVPAGLAQADASSRDAVLISLRTKFKRVVHACVGLLVVTGAFNSWWNWRDFSLRPGVMHGIWGMHMLLGLVVIGISEALLAKPEPPKNHRRTLGIALAIMFVVVALASTLKFVRDTAVKANVSTKSGQADR